MKRQDEEFCKLRFQEYISELYPSESIEWEDVPPKEEPPDFYLYLDGVKFAVEVSAMVELVDVGTARAIPRHVVNSTYVNFVKGIEKEVKEKGWLSGTYTVRIHRIIKNFGAVETELREQILYYIQATKELETAEAQNFYIDYVQFCSINKSSNTRNVIYPGLPGSAKWEGQSTGDSITLLEERLTDKVEKLRNLSAPIILLINDTNLYFPNNLAFSEAVQVLPDISRFHTVFIASPSYGDFVLRSENKEWQDIVKPTSR